MILQQTPNCGLLCSNIVVTQNTNDSSWAESEILRSCQLFLACAVLNCFAGSGYWPYTDDEDVRYTGENTQGHTILNAHIDPKNPLHRTLNHLLLSETLLPHLNTWALLSEHIHSQHRGHYISDCLLSFRPLIASSSSVAVLLYLCSHFLHACLDDASCQGKFWWLCFGMTQCLSSVYLRTCVITYDSF